MSASPFQTSFDNPLPDANDNPLDRLAKLEARALTLEAASGANVSSFNGRTGAVTLLLGDISAVADARYVKKAGDSMTGPLVLNVTGDGITITATGAAIMTSSYIETGFQFSHYKDTSINTAPVTAEFYHDTTAGTPAVADGSSIDLSMDSDTVKRQPGLRIRTQWTVAADATRTATAIFFVPNAGTLSQALQFSPTTFGAFGTAAVVKQTSGANLTNNVTVGGTNDVIADFTSLTVYATDAAAIRNDIFQLARKLKQVNDALRAYGMLT